MTADHSSTGSPSPATATTGAGRAGAGISSGFLRRSSLLALSLTIALVSGCAGGGTSPTTTTPPTESSAEPSQEPTSEPTTEPTGETEWTTAYFMVDTRAGLRLARERQDLGATGVEKALDAMIAGPVDPDYITPWNPLTEVLAVSQDDDLITVDLSDDARTADIGSEGAALMIQQLVWTVTEAVGDPAAAVQLLIEGEPAGELWGAVVWDSPETRAEAMSVRVLVQLDVPAENEVLTSPITISGEAAAFEATVPWTIRDSDGADVASGFAMTTEGQTFAPFTFDVELPPGEYTVTITEDDPSGGQGGTPMSDTRTFLVQ